MEFRVGHFVAIKREDRSDKLAEFNVACRGI